MSDEPQATQAPRRSAVDPTLENLRLAYERTILAYTRTALALISFGFTIAKFFEALEGRSGTPPPLLHPRTVCLTMIGMGLFSLLLAVLQLRQGRKVYPQAPRSVAGMLAFTIAVLGILALIVAIFHH